MNLARYLKHSGRTQAEFAREAGTTQGRISQLIRNPGEMPRLSLAQRIEEVSGGAVGLSSWKPAKKVARRG